LLAGISRVLRMMKRPNQPFFAVSAGNLTNAMDECWVYDRQMLKSAAFVDFAFARTVQSWDGAVLNWDEGEAEC
jgi:hypothetical protein